MCLKGKNIDTKCLVSFSPVTHPVADVFQESRCAHTGLCLPQGLLDATAIKEYILLLRVAVEITEDLQWPNKGEKKIQVRSIVFFLSFLKGFIYLLERKRERTRAGRRGRGKGEADPPLSREHNMGLNHRTLGSWPEPKADT